MYGAATSSAGSKVRRGCRPGVVEVARAARVPRRRTRGCRAGAASRASPTTRRRTVPASATRPALAPSRSTRTAGAVVGRADALRAVRSGRGARPGRRTRRGPRRAICTIAPSSSLNSVRNGSSPQPSRLDVEAQARGERHLAQRGERAAVGTVVVGQQQAGFARVADQFEEARAGAADRRGRARRRANAGSATPWPDALRQDRAAEALLAGAQADQPQLGVGVARRAAASAAGARRRRGANAETISDTGDTDLLRDAVGRATAPASTASPCRPGC